MLRLRSLADHSASPSHSTVPVSLVVHGVGRDEVGTSHAVSLLSAVVQVHRAKALNDDIVFSSRGNKSDSAVFHDDGFAIDRSEAADWYSNVVLGKVCFVARHCFSSDNDGDSSSCLAIAAAGKSFAGLSDSLPELGYLLLGSGDIVLQLVGQSGSIAQTFFQAAQCAFS